MLTISVNTTVHVTRH